MKFHEFLRFDGFVRFLSVSCCFTGFECFVRFDEFRAVLPDLSVSYCFVRFE